MLPLRTLIPAILELTFLSNDQSALHLHLIGEGLFYSNAKHMFYCISKWKWRSEQQKNREVFYQVNL